MDKKGPKTEANSSDGARTPKIPDKVDEVYWEGVDEVGKKGEALPAGEEEFVVELVVEEQDCGGDPA